MNTLKSKLFMLTLLLIGVVAMSFAFVNRGQPEVEVAVKTNTELQTYRWFKITNDHDPSAPVPPGDAEYLGEGANPPDEAEECEPGEDFQCISGFDPTQTTGSPGSYTLNGAQAPQALAPNVLRD